jgi:eukaryotic-like serine/threonine-protein kinase
MSASPRPDTPPQVTLAPGTRLGPYEIVALVGAGAMGQVYKARDVRLGRHVAIKILPAALTHVSDRVTRFAQEARAAAALNHPGVLVVFDVDVDGPQPYVVSELLDGETLRAAIARGALPPKKAADLGAQIAAGLAAAHHKGIVHRDLKPENVFITTEGRAKILDFGLARLIATEGHPSDAATTTGTNGTLPGTVLGTVGYMAPEQVRGESADHRSDIFAFGAVLYEMLAGRPAFVGASAIERLHGILQQDPPAIGSAPPGPLEQIARRCLEKRAAQRFQSADDIAFAIQALSTAGSDIALQPTLALSPPAASPSGPRRRIRWGIITVSGIALAVAVALGFLAARRFVAPRATEVTFEARTFDRLPITNARFMPDGQTIVYSAPARGDRPPDLYIINAHAEAPQPLGLSRAHLLSISSAGELALITDAVPLAHRLHIGTLARMTLGSSPRPMMREVREADWSPDGASLAVVRDLRNGRDRLEYPAGTGVYDASGYLSDPRVSPDGAHVAFVEHPWRFDDRGAVKTVDRHGVVTSLTGELWGVQGLAWTPDGGRVVFSGNPSGGSLMQPMSVPIDGKEPASVLFGVPGRFIVHDVARDGRWLGVREDLAVGVRAAVPGQSGERDLSWLGSSGARALSSDGAWLLMVDIGLRSGRDYGVVLRKTDGSQPIRLGEGNPRRLSPDGQWATAILTAPARLVLYPTGSGDAIRLDATPIERVTAVDWFPDSRRVIIGGSEAGHASRCYVQSLSGGRPTPLIDDCLAASVAADGRTLLITRPDGSWQLSSIDGGPGRPPSAMKPGDRPIGWSGDGQSIYVQRGTDVPAIVDRIDLRSGTRETVRQLVPSDVSSLSAISISDWIDDGRGYAYTYTSLTSTLFLVSGALNLQ